MKTLCMNTLFSYVTTNDLPKHESLHCRGGKVPFAPLPLLDGVIYPSTKHFVKGQDL